VITNTPSAHQHAGGAPDGHPDIESYLGLPIYWNGRLMAMIGVANREDGYDQAMVDRCQPLLTLIGNLVRAHKVESERDSAMYELAVAKGRYDLAVAGSAMGVWEYNVATDLIFVSERALAILGETPDAVYPGGAGLMQPIQDFVKRLHPADFDYGAQAMRDHIVENKPYDIQLRMRHVDGDYRMVSISGIAERNADGKPLRMAGSMQDITDRMRLREERERSAARLAAVTELGGVGAWEVDLKAGTLFWDEITCRIHDLPPDYKSDLETAIDFYAPEARESITAAVESGIERGESWDMELPLITATGRRVWVRALGRAVREAGETVRLVGGFQDITEDKELAAELLKRRAEADAANLAKSEFIANMSHEIRTPLHGVLATAQLLTMTELDEDQTQCVEVIQDSGQMLLGLIEEVLDFSKIETGSLSLSPHDFGLQGMINTVSDNVAALARQKGLKFSVSMEHGLPDAVHGDEKRLRQVLTNLMGNAVKFTAEGAVTLSVSRVDGAVLRFEVRDTWPGIGEEDRRKIFERFAQADTAATRAHGGAGLGLAIAQNIVELSGGRIGVDSTPGEGSTFWFEAPLVAEEAEQAQPPAPKPAAAKAVRANKDRPGEGMRILVADDVPTNRMVVSEYLRHKGFEIALAENGKEALDQVMTDQFDAVLMDVQMPVMSGDEAIEKIRQSGESWASMPVYALTADATRRTRERLASIGIDGYFTKPLEMEAIVDALVQLKSPDGPRQAAE
jgi:PAS domain S-box-containing protein